MTTNETHTSTSPTSTGAKMNPFSIDFILSQSAQQHQQQPSDVTNAAAAAAATAAAMAAAAQQQQQNYRHQHQLSQLSQLSQLISAAAAASANVPPPHPPQPPAPAASSVAAAAAALAASQQDQYSSQAQMLAANAYLTYMLMLQQQQQQPQQQSATQLQHFAQQQHLHRQISQQHQAQRQVQSLHHLHQHQDLFAYNRLHAVAHHPLLTQQPLQQHQQTNDLDASPSPQSQNSSHTTTSKQAPPILDHISSQPQQTTTNLPSQRQNHRKSNNTSNSSSSLSQQLLKAQKQISKHLQLTNQSIKKNSRDTNNNHNISNKDPDSDSIDTNDINDRDVNDKTALASLSSLVNETLAQQTLSDFKRKLGAKVGSVGAENGASDTSSLFASIGASDFFLDDKLSSSQPNSPNNNGCGGAIDSNANTSITARSATTDPPSITKPTTSRSKSTNSTHSTISSNATATTPTPQVPGSKPLPPADQAAGSLTSTSHPAWVFCTRYSDRPSSGPRTRRNKVKAKKEKSLACSIDEKRPRTAFTNEQLEKLKMEFKASNYLDERRRKDLADRLNLNENQIKIWFQNKRAKIKKQSNQPNPLRGLLVAGGLYNHSTATSECSESYKNDADDMDTDDANLSQQQQQQHLLLSDSNTP